MNPSLWNDSRVIKMFYLCLIGLFLFLIGGFINELKTSAFIGSGTTATNTIVVSGTGDTYAAPDIATVSFSVTKEGATVATAQKLVDEKMNAAIVALKGMGIADKDIKLENNSFNPKYDYGTPCYGGMGIPCSQTSPKIIGYEATRSVVVKVRKLDNAGTVVTALGTLGATNLYGPTFSLDDEDAVNAAARLVRSGLAKRVSGCLCTACAVGGRLRRQPSQIQGADYRQSD